MISRRRFLEVGSATAGASLALRPLRAGQENKTSSSLPSSLATLKSRKNEASPITREERADRIERARKLMAENGLDAILLAEGTSLRYFTGIRWWGSERLFAFVLPARGSPFYVCPAFEEGRAREQISNGGETGGLADVRAWQEDENPYQRIAQGLSDHGISGARVGIE